jgi:hypothetical protein
LILANLPGPLSFIGGLILMFLVVPWERVKELFWVGMIGGLLVALILVYLMQNTFGFWIFHQVDLVYIFRLPFFLSAAWIPVVILFSHFLIQSKSKLSAAITVLAFPTGSILFLYLLMINQMLTFHNWNLFFTFLVSLLIHLGIVSYLYASEQLKGLKRIT